MKTTTMKTLVNYFAFQNGLPSDVADAVDEMKAELRKGEDKAAANRELYAMAHDAVLAVIEDTPITMNEIYEACEDNLPEGFTKAKVQYALLHYWNDEVVKVDNGKDPKTYRKV